MLKPPSRPARSVRALAQAAFAAAALHAVAALLTPIFLAPGVPPGGEAAARAAWVDGHTLAWRLGWALWAASALALLVVLALLAPETPLARLGLAFAAAGLATDLLSQSVLTLALPGSDAAARALLEDAAWSGAAVVGNGLYTLAVALVAVAATREEALSRRAGLASVPVWAAGALLSVAAAAEAVVLTVVAGAALALAVVGWLTLVGVEAWRAS